MLPPGFVHAASTMPALFASLPVPLHTRPWKVMPIRTLILCSIVIFVAGGRCSPVRMNEPVPDREPVAWSEIAAQPAPSPGQRIPYGDDPLQFGELRVPTSGKPPYPVVVLIHGGCWQSAYDLAHVLPVSESLARAGFAVWTLEYRRIGNAGGGWTGTFDDVARGTDALRTLAAPHRLDLERVVFAGHSAGGHLALWLASRKAPGLRPRAVVSLAGITDLRRYSQGTGDCNASVAPLLGGLPDAVPDRYAQASPIELVPLGVPVRLVHGALDPIVPLEQSERFAEAARSRGDDAQVVVLPGAGHFDVIAPFAPGWTRVEAEIRAMSGR